jgi:hypothetical protein
MTTRRDLLAAATLAPWVLGIKTVQAAEEEKAEDVIGMPRTPLSFAGARRRAWRRAVVY